MSDKLVFYGFVLIGLYLVLQHAGVIPPLIQSASGAIQSQTQTLQGR